jgi:gas vesicle protein
MDEQIQSSLNRIKNLTQYRGLSEEKLIEIATAKVKEFDNDLNVADLFEDKLEKKQAKELLRRYIKDYVIDTISDKNTVKQVVYLEILNNRLQTILNSFHKDSSKVLPLQLVDSVHKNIDAIVSLKEKLGLLRDKNKEQQNTVYEVLGTLKKKFKKWREENQASRFVPCAHCGKNTLLKIRIDAWEAQKHPFFKDKLLFNEEIIRLYVSNIITKENVAKIFGFSKDHVDWLVDKAWKTNPKYTQIENDIRENK